MKIGSHFSYISNKEIMKYVVLFGLFVRFGQVSLHYIPSTASANHLTDYINLQNYAGQRCSPSWTMPLVQIGKKFYYVGTYFMTNWYTAFGYCRFHGLHLATITSAEENGALLKYLFDLGGQEHYWVSGSDLGSEGNYVWMSTGQKIMYSDWWAGQPDNSVGEKNETENCICLWNPQGNGLRWNDCMCSSRLLFVCELHQ